MSQSTIDLLGVIGAICGILAFLGPILNSLAEMILPYSVRFERYNLKFMQKKLKSMDIIYNDPRRLTTTAAMLVVEFMISIIWTGIGIVGILATHQKVLINNIYVDEIAQTACAIISIRGIFGSIITKHWIIYIKSPTTSSKRSLERIQNKINNAPRKMANDAELLDLKRSIEKMVMYGSWNSAEPEFDPREREKAFGEVGASTTSNKT